MCVNILAVGILKSPFKHALVCLSLFFSLSIYVCKKACHLLLDQPLQMALPLLLSLLLLLPPLPPSLRPSTQVFAWFSFAKPPPPLHLPTPSLFTASCCLYHLHSCNKGLVPPAQRWLLWLHSKQSSVGSSPFSLQHSEK